MNPTPWLTIVTVVKDDPEGFDRTLTSVASQDLSGVEYLVVDSSADRGAVPGMLASTSVTGTITWTEPRGIYPAMNTGLELAAGDYVHFLNAGDQLASDRVLAQLRELVNAQAPEWLYGDVEIVGTDGSVVVTPPWDYEAERATAFSRGRFPAHQGTVAKTSVLRAVGGFDTSYRIVADYAAFLRLTRECAPARADLVIARFHEGGVSTNRWAASLREFHRARREILRPTGAAARRERLESARQFAAMAAYRSPWPLTVGLMALSCGLMGLTGVSWTTAVLLTCFVTVQGLGGAIWWRLLRPRRSVPVLEVVGMGLGLGTAAALLTGLAWAWWLAPVIAIAIWLVLVRGRGLSVASLAPLPRPDLLALAVGLVPGVASLLLAFRSYPLDWVGRWTSYHGDMPFFEALGASVAKLGAGASIFMSGYDIRYHSLAYGWAGQLTMTADAAPFVVLTRLLPFVTLVAVTALAGAWTRRLTRSWWAPSLAVVLVVVGGFVGATYGSVLNFDSPSQSVGAVWLLALSVVGLQALDRVSLPWHLLAVAALVVALTGGKVSTAAIAAGGFALVVVVALLRREPWRWRALAVGAMGLVALVGTFIWLLAGSANAGGLGLLTFLDRASSVQGLNPVITNRGIVAGIAILIVAVLPRWAGLAWLVGDRETRWRPETVYGVGLAAGGTATIALLSGGFNDLWFAVAASAPLAVLSAVGAARAVAWLGPAAKRRALLAGLLGLVGSVAVAGIWTTGSTGIIGNGWRWAGPLVGVAGALLIGLALGTRSRQARTRVVLAYAVLALVTMALPGRLLYALAEPFARPHEGSVSAVLFSSQGSFVPTLDADRPPGWTDAEAAAGRWLRTNAGASDLVATNTTSSAIVPALTRLPTFISDLPLQTPYGRKQDVTVAQTREQQSWAFIDQPTRQTVAPLCQAGVRWVWVDPRRTSTSDWSPFAATVLNAPDVIVLRVEASACR